MTKVSEIRWNDNGYNQETDLNHYTKKKKKIWNLPEKRAKIKNF